MGYRLAELFAIRPTGVPFEVLESLATPVLATAARELIARKDELSAVVVAAAAAIDRCESLSLQQRRRLRHKILKRSPILAGAPDLVEVALYLRLLPDVAAAENQLKDVLAREYEASRQRIYEHAAAHLPDIAAIQLSSGALAQMLERRAHNHDRTLAIWLQRMCSKNDTISRFGPSCWGSIDPAEPGVRIAARPGIAGRVAWVERWVVDALIAAINRDPEVRDELAPRINPLCEVQGNHVRWHDSGAEVELTPEEAELLARCDGRTPAYQLDAANRLTQLAERSVLVWQLEPLFIDDGPLATLIADVAAWRQHPVRHRWSEKLHQLGVLADEYLAALEAGSRLDVLRRLQAFLADLGIDERIRTGRIYEASNPIVENCYRTGDFAIGERAVHQLIADATPWFDLFRDASSTAALAVYAGLRELYIKAPRHHGRLSLPALMAFAEANNLSLRGSALARFANAAFGEIRAGFARRLASRVDAPEWELTPEDCRFLVGPHVPREDLAYPSADLQIAAASPDAVARGDYQWVISELHHGLAVMQHCLSWSCPDPPQLAARLRDCQLHQALLHHDSHNVHAPVHAGTESVLSALESVNVVSTWRTRPHWRSFAPSQVDVVLDEEHCDVRARCVLTGTDLGTLLPLARFFFGLHPFFPLQLEHHTPRLRRGKTVLQRRSWVISIEELDGGPFAKLSSDLVIAVERLRAARDLPRWVFLRLRDDVLSGAEASNRLKDVKPICIDLESYVFIEIFARRLDKYGKVELVEMLPAPDQLVWREADGHRCFELRTLLGPT